MKCWTCGHPVAGHTFNCGYCRNLEELQRFHSDTIAELRDVDRGDTAASLHDLAVVQQQGFAEISRAIEEGLDAIASAISWGFQELKWELERQTTTLRNIDHTLRTPRETQGNELREMAEELRRRDVLDESEEFFLKALEMNRLDYRMYVGLAETHLRQNKFAEARGALERSLPHAPKKEIDYKSYSLRLIGHVYECAEDYSTAAAKAREALSLSPKYAEAQYDYAKYIARVGDVPAAISALEGVIELNPIYWYTSAMEANFSGCRPEVNSLLERLEQGVRSRANGFYQSAHTHLSRARSISEEAEGLWKRAGKSSRAPVCGSHILTAENLLAAAEDGRCSEDYAETLAAIAPLAKADAEVRMAIDVARKEAASYRKHIERRRRTRLAWLYGTTAYLVIAGVIGAIVSNHADSVLEGFAQGLYVAVVIPFTIAIILAIIGALFN